MAFNCRIEDLQKLTFDRLFDQRIMQNYIRPHYVETMVAEALRSAWRFVGEGWSAWDFERPDGLRLEVKQSAMTQPWNELNGKITQGVFGIEPKKFWFESGGSEKVISDVPVRPADIYMFAWHSELPHKIGCEPVDQRDPFQWRFFVLPENVLPPNQKTVRLQFVKREWRKQSDALEGLSIDELFAGVDKIASSIVMRSIPVRRSSVNADLFD